VLESGLGEIALHSICKYIFILFMFGSIAIADSSSKTKTINLHIVDEATDNTIPAHVLIKSDNGQCYYPPKAVLLNIGPEIWFMSSGNSSIKVPPGKVLLRVERGKEYIRIKQQLDNARKESINKKVVLKKWIDLKQRGYFSGENHLHRSPDDVAALCAAEDLDFGTVLQWWNKPRFEIQGNEGFPVYPDTPEGIMQMNTNTYYRLLNCDLKLAAGAGSATGAKEVPVGYNRAYVRCSDADGLNGFLKAWAEGKNFVTNGPMLFFRSINGLQPKLCYLFELNEAWILFNN
jgi:hypothetical protein